MNLMLHRALMLAGLAAAATTGWLAARSLWPAAGIVAALALWLGTRPLGLTPEAVAEAKPAEPIPADTLPAANPFGLLDGMAEPAIVIDADRLLRHHNEAAQRIFGKMQPGEPVSLYLRHPAALEAIQQSIAKKTSIAQDVTLLSPVERSFNVVCSPADSAGALFLIQLHDVTKLKLTERMRADFVANASHELRTPLTTVIGFLETLQGSAGADKATRERFLSIMAKEAGRMARLIDDLLSLSRIEMDKSVAPVTPIDLIPVLKDIGSTLAVRLDADSRFIQLELEEPLPAVIADRDQILQVLHNLISNALKYGRTGTAIVVSAVTQGNFVRLTVADQGDGIAAEHLPRLTERFYRVDTARSRDLGGTGLGLAIVKHIVERHRGELEIRSVPGQGTAVTFSLPCALPRPVSA